MISEKTQIRAVTLTAINDCGVTRHYELPPNQGVFVGTSSNCGLQLSGDELSGIHCRIGLEEGVLWVQDWMSAAGTLVNGESISSKSEVQLADVIQIGKHRITVAAATTSACNAKESLEQEAAGDSITSSTRSNAMTEESNDLESCDNEPADYELTEYESTDCERSGSESVLLETDSPMSESIGFDAGCFDFDEEETFDRETVALLQAEIEDLQAALAQRDAERFSESPENGESHECPGQPVLDGPDEVLQRMQELIEEANRSDERVAILDEMLHASEEANRSGLEEREELKAWVGDIESRIGQSESEHAAEVETLRRRLEESHQEQERLQRQLQQSAFNGNVPKQYEETLENLQKSNNELQEALAESEKLRHALELRLESQVGQHDRDLREERASIAKERARLSRLRFEVSSQLAAVEELPKTESQADKETAHRIQTLRQHLREIHEQEKKEEKEATLATRFAKLWKRVEY